MVVVSTPPPRIDFGLVEPLRGRVTPRLDVPVPEREGQLGDRGDRDPERQRLEEVPLVERIVSATLAQRPALGRQRLRRGLRGACFVRPRRATSSAAA